MKSSKQCPKCESLAIGILGGIGPIAWFRSPDQPDSPAQTTKRSADLWVCTECGYAESYFEADKLNWDEAVAFRWVNPKPDAASPYR